MSNDICIRATATGFPLSREWQNACHFEEDIVRREILLWREKRFLATFEMTHKHNLQSSILNHKPRYSGMLPCFFFGISSCLVSSISRAFISRARVWLGMIMSSI